MKNRLFPFICFTFILVFSAETLALPDYSDRDAGKVVSGYIKKELKSRHFLVVKDNVHMVNRRLEFIKLDKDIRKIGARYRILIYARDIDNNEYLSVSYFVEELNGELAISDIIIYAVGGRKRYKVGNDGNIIFLK